MPTNRHRRPRLRRAGISLQLDEVTEHALITGDRCGRLSNSQLARQMWEEHGDEITARFATVNPGRRPWGWWEFDAPEPMRAPLWTEGHKLEARTAILRDHSQTEVEILDTEAMSRAFGVLKIAYEIPPVYESEAAFLQRHGLLTRAERKAMGTAPAATN